MVFNVFLFYLPAYGRDAAVYRAFEKEETFSDQSLGIVCMHDDIVGRSDVFLFIFRFVLLGICKYIYHNVSGNVRMLYVML